MGPDPEPRHPGDARDPAVEQVGPERGGDAGCWRDDSGGGRGYAEGRVEVGRRDAQGRRVRRRGDSVGAEEVEVGSGETDLDLVPFFFSVCEERAKETGGIDLRRDSYHRGEEGFRPSVAFLSALVSVRCTVRFYRVCAGLKSCFDHLQEYASKRATLAGSPP